MHLHIDGHHFGYITKLTEKTIATKYKGGKMKNKKFLSFFYYLLGVFLSVGFESLFV